MIKVGGRPFVWMMYLSLALTPFTTGGRLPVTTSASHRFSNPVAMVRDQRFRASSTVGSSSETPLPVRPLMGTTGMLRRIGIRSSICSRTLLAKSRGEYSADISSKSILLAAITRDRPSSRTALHSASSCRCTYNSSASSTRTATSATFMALKASATAMSSMASSFVERFASFRIPAVSTNRTSCCCCCCALSCPSCCRPWCSQYHSTAMASRVRPGVGPARTRLSWTRVLTRVLFPTFCRPMMAIWSGLLSLVSLSPSLFSAWIVSVSST
mmetsp:Transcript_15187/g.32646  ORF Transcript_15187/g.32646 Transcript_15187/m.32646 type:complete len:271 (-) Transcript_15187:1243-2055(-)